MFLCHLVKTLALKYSLFISDGIDVFVSPDLSWNFILWRHDICGALHAADDESAWRKGLHLYKIDSSSLEGESFHEQLVFSSCLFSSHQWFHEENEGFF